MRKIVVISGLLILMVFQGVAQPRQYISKDRFNKHVNYAGCRYINEYAESLKDKHKDDYKKFKDKIYPETENTTIDTSLILSELLSLMRQNNWANTAKILDQQLGKVDESDFKNDSISLDKAIEILKVEVSNPAQNAVFSKIYDSIKIEITQYHQNNNTDQSSSVIGIEESKSDTDTSNKLTEKIVELRKEMPNTGLLVLLLVWPLFLLILLLLFLKILVRNEVDRAVEIAMRKSVKRDQSGNAGNKKNMSIPSGKLDKSDDLSYDKIKNQLIVEVVKNLEKSYNLVKKEMVVEKDRSDPTLKQTKYLMGKRDTLFTIESSDPEASFFRIVNERGNEAEFNFIGDLSDAISKNILTDDITERISGDQLKAKSIKIVKNGKIRKEENGWRVTGKLKVEFLN